MEYAITQLTALLRDESLAGFLIRLCEINGVPHPNIVAERFHTSAEKMRWGKDVGSLSVLSGNRQLLKTAQRRPRKGEHAEFYGHKVDWNLLAAGNERQVCPECLRGSRHVRHFWEIGAFETCPIHGVAMESECACGRPLSWDDAAIDRPNLCDCEGSPLARQDALSTPFELWLAGRLGIIKASKTSSWMDSGDLFVVTRFLHSLGREIAEDFPSKPPSRKREFSVREKNAFSRAGYDALVGNGFEQVVSRLVRRHREDHGDTPPEVPARALGRFGERCVVDNERAGGLYEPMIVRINLAVASAYREKVLR